MESLQDKAVLITGASRGIGRALALTFAARGAKIALIARDEDALRSVQQEIYDAGGEAFHLFCDVRDEWSVKRTVEDVHAQLEAIDILINNAGVGIHGRVESYSLANWRTTIETNMTSVFLMCRAVIPVMRTQGVGRIINVASGAGRNGIASLAAYCASKHGLIGFTESLALEVRGDGILVSTAIPGSTETQFSGRVPEYVDNRISTEGRLSPFEVAEAIASLCETNPNAWISELVIRPLKLKQ